MSTTFESLLARDGYLVYKTRGVSMEPMLRQNKDLVTIRVPVSRLQKYDVALYRRGDAYVLHRVIGVMPDHYRIRGDNTYAVETVPDSAVIGVLAGFEFGNEATADNDAFIQLGKDVAMQIAAMNPKYWDKALVPQADIDHELEVQVALMNNDPKMAAKPQAIKEKIASGKINAFYKENCLLQQDFVRSDLFQGSVEGYIADAAKKLGGKVTFVKAVRFEKGEGIEKKVEDFAAEVAAQMNMGK